jgi:rubrerythrin
VRWYSPQQETGGSGETATDEINEFFKTILQSKRLRPEEKRDLEVIAKMQSKVDAEIEDAKRLAKDQARKVYTCEGCGLQVMGILAFAEHDEATRHMTYRGKKVTLQGPI